MPDLGENELVKIRQTIREWSFDDAVSFGLVPGFSNRNIFGTRIAVPTGGPFDLSPTLGPSGTAYVFPNDAGEAMELVADAADSGVITVFILDEDQGGIEVQLNLPYSGDTPVPLPGKPSRVIEAFVSGPNLITAPAVIRRVGGDNQVFAAVQVENQRSDQCIFTVPRDKTAIIKRFISSIEKPLGTTVSVVIRICIRLEGGIFTVPSALGLISDGDTAPEFDNKTATELPPFTDIIIAVSGANQTGADIAARIGFRLKDLSI